MPHPASVFAPDMLLVLCTLASAATTQAKFGTEKEAKAMLEKPIAEVKKDKGKALEMFNKGEGGFQGP